MSIFVISLICGVMAFSPAQCCCDKILSKGSSFSEADVVRVKSTVQSFHFLYENAESLARCVSKEELFNKLVDLHTNSKKLEAPSCPETEGDACESMVLLQKINRYLFDEVDNDIYNQFKSQYPDVDFSFPVIEWAENVMPDIINVGVAIDDKRSEDEVFKQVREILTAWNSSSALTEYFKLGYENLAKRLALIEQKTSEDEKELDRKALFLRLKCSMCYPARVSCVVL